MVPSALLQRGQSGFAAWPILCMQVGIAMWGPQENRDRWTRYLCGRCSSACVLMWRDVVHSIKFTGEVSNVLMM